MNAEPSTLLTANLEREAKVRALHTRVPVYALMSSECKEHDQEVHAVEVDGGGWYCDQHVDFFACAHCCELDSSGDGDVEHPCATIRILDGTD